MREVALILALALLGTGVSIADEKIEHLEKKQHRILCIEGYKYIFMSQLRHPFIQTLAPKFNKQRQPEKCFKKKK